MDDLPNNTLLCILHEEDISHDLSSFPLTWGPDDRRVAIEKIKASRKTQNSEPVFSCESKTKKITSLPTCYDLFKREFPLHKISKKSLNNWSVNDFTQAQKMLNQR